MNLIIESNNLYSIFNNIKNNISEDNFIDLLEFIVLNDFSLTLIDDELMSSSFELLYSTKNLEFNDDLILINRMLERGSYFDEDECRIEREKINHPNNTLELNRIFETNTSFESNNPNSIYLSNPDENHRLINSVDKFKKFGYMLSTSFSNPDDYIGFIKKICSNLIFDANIIDSISRLTEPFLNRKHEISYHLYIIDKEVPLIVSQGITSYRQIGDSISITCSPERDRDTVQNSLTVIYNESELNCELHTKLKRVGDRPPDRIYFCPCIPEDVCPTNFGKIYIYQITKHV